MRILFFCGFLFLLSCTEQNTVVKEKKSDISILSEKILESPNDTTLLIQRRDYFLELNRLEAALIDIEYLYLLDSMNFNRTFDLASTYFTLAEEGKSEYYNKAFNVLNSSRVTEKSHFPSLLIRAKLYYIFKMYELSLTDLNNSLRINKYLAEAYFYKGLNFKEMGEESAAMSQFQTAIEQDPDYLEGYEQLAFMYASKGDPLAELYFDNALSVDSSLVSVWYNKGKYYQDKGAWSNAIGCYRAMLRREPFNTSANYNIGFIHLVEGRYLDGANSFSDVIYSKPGFATAYFSRGLCFKNLKEYNKAEFDFKKTLSLDPDFFEAQEELSTLRN